MQIREGDEWKTPLSTTAGLVMPYGLANTPSVFQTFLNDILHDMLGRIVITYIDHILIYSCKTQNN